MISCYAVGPKHDSQSSRPPITFFQNGNKNFSFNFWKIKRLLGRFLLGWGGEYKKEHYICIFHDQILWQIDFESEIKFWHFAGADTLNFNNLSLDLCRLGRSSSPFILPFSLLKVVRTLSDWQSRETSASSLPRPSQGRSLLFSCNKLSQRSHGRARNQPSAFCSEHSKLARERNIPTNLRAFIHDYCQVPKNPDGKIREKKLT